MLSALLFGVVASSALVIGGVAGAYWSPPRHLVAVALAFASGALITALAFDLFEESFKRGGAWLSGIGLLAGAAAFVVADTLLDRYIAGAGSGVSAFALLAGVTLDGVPENMALGVSLLETSGAGALTLLVAIFASNLPEALGGAVGMRQQGRSEGFTIGVWSATAILLAAAVVVGNAALAGVGEKPLSLLLSFAGGAVLASLADTLMPDAYREGGPLVAFATAAGFLLSFLIAEVKIVRASSPIRLDSLGIHRVVLQSTTRATHRGLREKGGGLMAIPLRRRMALLALTALVAVALMAASALPVFATPKQYACEDPNQPGVVFILSKHEATEFEQTHPGATCTELSG